MYLILFYFIYISWLSILFYIFILKQIDIQLSHKSQHCAVKAYNLQESLANAS